MKRDEFEVLFTRHAAELSRIGWKLRLVIGLVVGLIIGITLVSAELFRYWARTEVFPAEPKREDVSAVDALAFLPVFTACGGVIGLLTMLQPVVLRYALIGGLGGALAESFASVTLPLSRPYYPATTILDERTVYFALLGAGGGVVLGALDWVRSRLR